MYSRRHRPLYPRKENPVAIPPKRRSGCFGQENISRPYEIRTKYYLAHNLVNILSAKTSNFRDGYIVMNVEKLRFGKKAVAACLQATFWHVPDMTE